SCSVAVRLHPHSTLFPYTTLFRSDFFKRTRSTRPAEVCPDRFQSLHSRAGTKCPISDRRRSTRRGCLLFPVDLIRRCCFGRAGERISRALPFSWKACLVCPQ